MNQKDAYIQKFQDQLDVWKKQVDQVRAQSAEMTAHGRAEYQKQLDSLKAHGETVKQQLAAAQSASEEAWADMRSKADQAWDSLQEATKQALNKFK